MSLSAARAAVLLFCLCVPVTIAGANMAWGLLALALAAHAMAGGRPAWPHARGELTWPLVAYLGAAIAAGLLGSDPGHSLRFLHQDVHKLWLYSLLSLGLAAARPQRPERALAASFAFAAVVGAVQWFGPKLPDGVPARAHAFVHPVVLGGQMALACVGAACFGFASNHRPVKRAARGLSALCAVAIVLSDTRAALAAAAAGIAAVLWASGRRRAILRAGIPLTLIAVGAGMWGMARVRQGHGIIEEYRQWRDTGAIEHPSSIFRLALWEAAWRMVGDHPLTGVGPNNYRNRLRDYYSGTLEGRATDWGSAHNLFLHQLAERGLLGLAALLWLLWRMGSRAMRRARGDPNPWNLWAFGAFVAFIVLSLTEATLENEIFWMLVFLIHLLSERPASSRN